MGALQKEQYYTYEEWLNLNLGDNTRSELIDGEIYLLASASTRHQSIAGEIFSQLSTYLKGKRCKPFWGLDVRLEKDTVVIPDLLVVCDSRKLTDAGCTGTPDLVIEILSPSTAKHDRFTKFLLYQRTGVPEYWIVDPADNILTIHRLSDGKYITSVYESTDIATVDALPGFEMDLSTVFMEESNEE